MAQAFRTQNLRLLGNLLDVNDNELIKFSSIASAVNELTISNAATTGSPSISATGDDTNIGLNLISKGTGLVQINGKAISLANSFTTSGNFALTFTTTATTSLTLPTSGTLATTSQIPTVYNNTLTLAGSGGISLSAIPTFTANASADKTITISIADGALTIAKLENIATSRILGRTSPSTGPVEVLDGTGVVSVIGTNAVTRATNLAGGSAGQIPYQSGANTTAFSAAGSTNQVLLSGGSGAPTWANQSSLSVGSATTAGSVANALTISSPLTGTSYNGSTAVSIGLQNASDIQAGGVSIGAQTFAGNKTFKDNVIVSGNLTVNGTTVTINSSTLSVDDKNIELGSVVAIPSLSATVNIDAGDTNVTVSSTNGLIVGQALTKISGTGAFGANPVISSITSATQFTVSPVHATTGSIVFSVGGATDVTANGGGITLKGTTDKTFNWVNATLSWTSSENLDLASGKTYKINAVDVLSSTTLGSGVINSSLTSVGTLNNLTVAGYTHLATTSGSVGIGTTSPAYKLDVNGITRFRDIVRFKNSAWNLSDDGQVRFYFDVSGRTYFGSGSGYEWRSVLDAGIMVLNNSGNLGIGTTTPLSRLDIRGSHASGYGILNVISTDAALLSLDSTGARDQGLRLKYNGIDKWLVGMRDTNEAFSFSNTADTRLVSILQNGVVGIGTTVPAAKLHLYGASEIVQRIESAGSRTYGFVVNPSWRTDSFSIYDFNADSARLLINSAGRISIGGGSNNPNNLLTIFGATSIGSNYNVTAPTNGLLVEGSVGIGTTVPLTTLDVRSQAMIGDASIGGVAYQTLSVGGHTRIHGTYRLQFGSANGGYASMGITGPQTGTITFNTWDGSADRERLRIVNTDGNVGIGTTTPATKLEVYDTSTTQVRVRMSGQADMRIISDTGYGALSNDSNLPLILRTNATERVRIDSGGNVGIGTTSPSTPLHVFGTGPNIATFTRDLATDASFTIGADNNGTVLGTLGVHNIQIYTNTTEKVRINSDGNVGIGTTNPVQKLDVSGSIYINNNASYLYGKTTGGSATRMIGINAVNDFYIGSVDQAVSSIRINNNGSDRVIIDSSGNVGIGITNLTYKLDVAGAIAMHDENQDIDSRFYGGTFLRGWSAFEAGNESNITYTTDTTCPVGIEVLSISTWTWARGPKIRLDKTQNYEVEFWIKRHAANTSGQFYFVVSNFDSNGTRITGDGTDWHYPTTFAQNTMVVGTWYKFKFIVGPYGGAKDHSPNARYISVGFIVNYTTGTDVIYMTGFKCRPIPRYNNDNLTLYNNGFVGIGTTIPSEKLDVIGGNISTSGEIYSLGGRLSLYRSAGNSYIDWSTGRNLIFRTETSVGGAGDSEKVRINSFGCVGIGTTNPLNKLDIYGGDVNIRNDSAGATSLCLRNWTSGGTAQMIFGTAPGDDQSTTLSFASNVFKIENYGDPTSSIKFGTRNTAGTSAIRMTINPDGNVGIDTETPNNKLSVLGSTSIGSGYNTAAPTNGLIVEGSVGIGSSSPAAKFVVSASSITTTSKDSYAVAIGNSNTDLTFGSDASYGYIQTWGSKPLYINNQGNNIILGGSIGLNVGIGTTNPNDRLTILAGNYLSFQTVNLTFNSGRAARIGATTTGSGIGELIFETYKGGSGGGEKMRINSDGNVGIGISTPVYKTEIYSGAKTSAFTGLAISNFNNYDGTATSLVTSQLRFAILENPITTYDASQRTFAILESGNEVNNSSSDGFFAISTRKTAVLSEKFRITSSGNVGIGTINPVTKLAILGGDDKDTGPIISLSGNSVNQFESGRIRFTEANIAASPFYQGAYVHYDGSNNVFNIGVHTNVDSLTSSDVNVISILRSNAFVGIGTTIPSTKLEVIGTVKATLFDGPVNQVNITSDDATNSSHYLYFGATNSGASIVKASTKIRFNPSTGAFSSTTKSFRIPHPTKPQHDLVYGSLESPYHGVRLTGKGKTNGNRAEVILPDYINILVDKETVHIQLTPIKCAKILYVDDLFIDDNKFTVKYDKSWFEKSKDVEFYWDFTAERKDVPKLIVEEKI